MTYNTFNPLIAQHCYSFNWFYYSIKSLLLGMKWVFKHQNLQMFCFKLNKYFSAIELVGHGSKTQLQVSKNWNEITSGKRVYLYFQIPRNGRKYVLYNCQPGYQNQPMCAWCNRSYHHCIHQMSLPQALYPIHRYVINWTNIYIISVRQFCYFPRFLDKI